MMTLRPRLKNFKKLIPSAVCGSIVIQIALLSCTERNPEGEPRRTPAMEMNYTVTKTNFVRREGFEKESPIVSREKVKFKLYADNDFTIRVDILDHEVSSFIISEAIPGNDYPVASYYEITPGKYQVYDTKGKVMSENTMPELNFSSLMDQLKEATGKQAALPGLITGGMLYFSLENSETKNTAPTALRKNNYGEAYQVYLNSYVNEFDGLSYTQESIVLKSNNTIEALRLYDSQNKIISSTSFRYEGEGKDIQLKNTQDVAVERNKDGSTSLFISLADYKDFTIALNLK